MIRFLIVTFLFLSSVANAAPSFPGAERVDSVSSGANVRNEQKENSTDLYQVMPAVTTLLLGPGTPSSNPNNIKSVAWWESRYSGAWDHEYKTYTPLSTNGDSYGLYNLSYAVDANNQMFLASGQLKYLDRALFYIFNTLATAQESNPTNLPGSTYHDGYLGWVNLSETGHVVIGQEYSLCETFLWRYVAHTLRLMRETPWVYNNPEYQEKYNDLLAFTEINIWEKWYTRGYESHMYRSRTHMSAHWAYIAAELAEISTDQTRLAQYAVVRDTINADGMTGKYSGESLRGQMVVQPGESRYIWYQDWDNTIVQDSSHGNGVISWITESHLLGYEWTATDNARLVKTLEGMWRESSYATHVDGTGTHTDGWYSDGFHKLGKFDINTQKRLELHDNGRGTQLYGGCAHNACVLLNQCDGKLLPSQILGLLVGLIRQRFRKLF